MPAHSTRKARRSCVGCYRRRHWAVPWPATLSFLSGSSWPLTATCLPAESSLTLFPSPTLTVSEPHCYGELSLTSNSVLWKSKVGITSKRACLLQDPLPQSGSMYSAFDCATITWLWPTCTTVHDRKTANTPGSIFSKPVSLERDIWSRFLWVQ